MNSGSMLVGRAFAQTGRVALGASAITLPIYDPSGSTLGCSHVQ